ncbi:MAG TPA: YbhB/YbcL family Raf kinase inhibitor-like protein [Acidimicrobiales bacterium]|nr:YbhB/YbcL family Raf kinase inhibitor-like protein [Acidimicrobiales bacterium]
MKDVARLLTIAVLAMAAPACSRGGGSLLASGERMPAGIAVTSPAFATGQPVPARFTCDGADVPPALAWSAVPAGTEELAVAVEDPDAPGGVYVHWLVVGIDPAAGGLAGVPAGATVLPGSNGKAAYAGPCPPKRGGAHHYSFEVYALPRRPALPTGGSPAARVRAVRRAATAGGSLVGTYDR